ncbi:MAG: hypothetical protein GXP47_02700 [Acidobacteria bacterium]|nr:hypothetical protein [Acidobacteriota bacterium]
MRERPNIGAEELVARVAGAIGVSVDELKSRERGQRLSRARELLAVLGVERWGIQVKDLAAVLGKHPVTVTGWVMRGVRRRVEDPDMASKLDGLDAILAGAENQKHEMHVPGT